MGLFEKLFRKKDQKPIVSERTFFNIQIGDIISYELEDFEVVGKLSYDDHGFKWYAYQLQGDQKSIWLAVEMDDELELGIYEKVNIKLKEPLPESIDHDGITYELVEQGTAFVSGEGRGNNVDGKKVKYMDYCDDLEEKFLSIEIWGSDVEVSTGYEIDDFDIKIIAGS